MIFRSNSNRSTGVKSRQIIFPFKQTVNRSIDPNRWIWDKHFAIFRHPDYNCARARCYYYKQEICYQSAIDAARHVAIPQNIGYLARRRRSWVVRLVDLYSALDTLHHGEESSDNQTYHGDPERVELNFFASIMPPLTKASWFCFIESLFQDDEPVSPE